MEVRRGGVRDLTAVKTDPGRQDATCMTLLESVAKQMKTPIKDRKWKKGKEPWHMKAKGRREKYKVGTRIGQRKVGNPMRK